jgi:MerR family transcriptional regulator, light-induced transcriptional regulator
MASAETERLDLRAAASELGVHYQTAYGWVRTGRLKAELVAGRYLVAKCDLDAVRRQRQKPSEPKPPGVVRVAHSADRVHEALVAGDEPAVRRVCLALLAEGLRVTDLIQQAIVPALVRIGYDWSEGRLTIWVEHRASAIVERILGEIAPNPRGRRRGTALVAAVTGDHHSLATSMAAVALREDNWHVEHLGADMPPTEIVDFCDHHQIDLAVITSTNPDTAPLARKTGAALQAAGTQAIVGEAGRTLDELVSLARTTQRPVQAVPDSKNRSRQPNSNRHPG